MPDIAQGCARCWPLWCLRPSSWQHSRKHHDAVSAAQQLCCAPELPVAAPLKTALTGVELLLARAQLWEESAAKHVSLAPQLASLASLATRWRRLELASWRCLLVKTAERHAAGQ